MGKRYETRIKNGKQQRRCNGGLHRGAWVDFENFRVRAESDYRIRKDGTQALRAECRACEYFRRNPNPAGRLVVGYVLISRYKPFMVEIKRRLGSREAARRIGIGTSTWANWFNGSRTYAQKQSIFRLLLVLREVRANNEVRHRASIRRGAKARGEVEKIPIHRQDFYQYTGDSDNEKRRKYRYDHLEEEQAADRRRRAVKRRERVREM